MTYLQNVPVKVQAFFFFLEPHRPTEGWGPAGLAVHGCAGVERQVIWQPFLYLALGISALRDLLWSVNPSPQMDWWPIFFPKQLVLTSLMVCGRPYTTLFGPLSSMEESASGRLAWASVAWSWAPRAAFAAFQPCLHFSVVLWFHGGGRLSVVAVGQLTGAQTQMKEAWVRCGLRPAAEGPVLFAWARTAGSSPGDHEMLADLLCLRCVFTFLLLKELIKPVCSNTISSPSINS